MFDFGPPGKHLHVSPQNPLHVGRIRFYRYFPGAPNTFVYKYVLVRKPGFTIGVFCWRSEIKDIVKFVYNRLHVCVS